jgi:hypothetical protein
MRAATAVADELPGLQRLRIELDAGVGEALVDVGHLLEQVVVGRDDDARARVGEGLEDRLGQGGALAGIRSHPDLVQRDQ